MPPDLAASYSSPNMPLRAPSAAVRLRLSLQVGPIHIVPRIIDPPIASALDTMEADDLPTFDFSGTTARVVPAIVAAMAAYRAPDTGFIAWLRDDLLGLVDLYKAATGARSLRVRLQSVQDGMGHSFHLAQVAFRLVTTYRGPGIEWIPPRLLAARPVNQPGDAAVINRLERGTIAILRGGKGATDDRPGVLHRSPPIAGPTDAAVPVHQRGGNDRPSRRKRLAVLRGSVEIETSRCRTVRAGSEDGEAGASPAAPPQR